MDDGQGERESQKIAKTENAKRAGGTGGGWDM